MTGPSSTAEGSGEELARTPPSALEPSPPVELETVPRIDTLEPSPERFAFRDSLGTRAARGTLINTAFTVGLGVLALLNAFILARLVSRADYGIWGIVAVSLSMLVWFKQAGIGDKFIQQDEPDQELAFQVAFTLELVATIACVVLIAIATPLLVLIYQEPKIVVPIVLISIGLLITVLQAPFWVFYRRMQFGTQQALAAAGPIASFAVSIPMAAAGAGYWSFVGGFCASACAAAATAVWASPYKLRLRWQPGVLRSYWSFSGPLLLASGATFVMAWSAVIAAKLDLGIAAVGVIALADNLASFSESVDGVMTGALYPAVCAIKDRIGLLYESLVKSNRLALMWAVPFGLGLTLFCGDLVRFGIGERWHPAIVVLQVYGIAAAINHIGFNWTAYFRAVGNTRPLAVATAAAAVTFLAVGIPLLLALGLRGFAIGILAQGLVALLMRVYYLRRMFPGFAFLRHSARSFLPALLAAAAVLLMRLLEPSTRTLGIALIELAVYLGVDAFVTWQLESGLLREALDYALGRRTAEALS